LTWEYKQGTHKDPKVAKAIKLHQQKKTNTEIAAELDVDRTTVGRWLKAA
jgi:predicted transcriptional regulator